MYTNGRVRLGGEGRGRGGIVDNDIITQRFDFLIFSFLLGRAG